MSIVRDITALAGLACVVAGGFIAARWVGLIALGVILVVIAAASAARHGRDKRDGNS